MIEPQFKNDKCVLYQGDCLEIMPQLEEQSIDAIITDLPYGTTACSWDVIIPLVPMWEQVKRVLKDRGAFVTTASQPFTSILICSNLEWFKYDWTWKKTKGSNFPHAPNMPLKITESVVVFSPAIIGHESQTENRMNYFPQGITPGKTIVKQNPNTSELRYHRESQTNHTTGYVCKNENYPTTLLEFSGATRGLHPTQKPVALYEYLIRTYTNEGDTVLDFCAGSGTTGIAAIKTGRKSILIEQDTNYFEVMKERIKKEMLQPSLFDFKQEQKPKETGKTESMF